MTWDSFWPLSARVAAGHRTQVTAEVRRSYLHHPGRARAVRRLVQCDTDKREGRSSAVAAAVAVGTGSVQTNWIRIPDMPSIIQVATNPAATVPPTRNRSANALLPPCAIVITRAPEARCESTKNTASQ